MERPLTIFTEPAIEMPAPLRTIEVALATIPNLVLVCDALETAAWIGFCLAVVGLIFVAARGALGVRVGPAFLAMTIASGPWAGLVFYLIFMGFFLESVPCGDY